MVMEIQQIQLNLTLKSIIERNYKELVAHLIISTGYLERKEKEKVEYDEMVQRMNEKTEALRLRNEEDRAKGMFRMTGGLDPSTGTPLI